MKFTPIKEELRRIMNRGGDECFNASPNYNTPYTSYLRMCLPTQDIIPWDIEDKIEEDLSHDKKYTLQAYKHK